MGLVCSSANQRVQLDGLGGLVESRCDLEDDDCCKWCVPVVHSKLDCELTDLRRRWAGQSPGPTIHANIGDRLLINVHNALTTNSTTVHWHGLHHAGTNFMDGTQSITQCGIPPGQSFTYNFTLNQDAMTTWWHSHSGTQYADGMFGGLVLHSANETAAFAPNSTTPAYDGEELFLLGDVYNTFSPELYWRYMLPGTGMDGQPGDEPVPDGG